MQQSPAFAANLTLFGMLPIGAYPSPTVRPTSLPAKTVCPFRPLPSQSNSMFAEIPRGDSRWLPARAPWQSKARCSKALISTSSRMYHNHWNLAVAITIQWQETLRNLRYNHMPTSHDRRAALVGVHIADVYERLDSALRDSTPKLFLLPASSSV